MRVRGSNRLCVECKRLVHPARGQVPDIRTIVIRLGSWARAPKRSGKGKLRDINSQTPRRRLILFRGVCCFSPHFRYFSCVLFGGKKKIIKFARRKGVASISNPEYIKINKLKKLRNALKLN